MSPQLGDHIEVLIAALGFIAFGTTTAWWLGFFTLPVNSAKPFPFFPTLGIFVLYFLFQIFVVPALVFGWLFLTEGAIPDQIGNALSDLGVGWVNLFSIVVATLIVIFYSLLVNRHLAARVWNEGNKTLVGIGKSVVMSAFSWLIVYPWVIVISQVVMIIFIAIWQQQPPNIDQEMVRHLKDIAQHKFLFGGTVFSVIFLVPIAEELIFRGFLQSYLRTGLGCWGAILLASAIFASLHYSVGQGIANWQIVLSLFIVSLYLGFLYERERTLWAPIALHVVINALSLGILFL